MKQFFAFELGDATHSPELRRAAAELLDVTYAVE